MKVTLELSLDLDDALIERLTRHLPLPDGGADGHHGLRALAVVEDLLEAQAWSLARPIGDVVDCEF